VWPAVPPAQVAPLLRSAGMALVPAPVSGAGTVPDTLYRAVAAGVPVVAADVGELATTVRGYRLGALYRPGDPASLVEAVQDVVRRYPDHVRRVRAAQRSLSWAADETVLLDVYAGLRPRVTVVELPVTEGTRLR
jgi:glycosyltransferase involved in cell wall biosynthesis